MEKGRIKINIDGQNFEVKSGRNLLHTCLALGFDIPHFCYHPALGSVGACRLCAVKKYKDDDDTKGKIVMSCMEPVADGLRVSIEDEEARTFRKAILESLMINHPHDCPVCDEGGECHLQDMTVMTGHNYRRFIFKKRTFKNQDLGPFINHEFNRCIQCYRCLRFYTDYAGGRDFGVFGSRDHLYFGRHSDGILQNEFSGNLVEVCPTGVFTDKLLKQHYIRKWDMTNAPSVCVNCSVGCNTIVSERYGMITRILNRYNGSVNGYFLCDRGRFGYEFINSAKRIKDIGIRESKDSDFKKATEDEFRTKMETCLGVGKNIIGIGSPRASLESNFALLQLVGKDNFYSGLSVNEQLLTAAALKILSDGAVHSPSLKEIEKADAVLILGEDLTNTAPMVALSVRQASRNESFRIAEKYNIPLWQDDAVRIKGDQRKSPVFIVTVKEDKLDDISEECHRAVPQDIARLGFAVASLIDDKAPEVKGLKPQELELARVIAKKLKSASNPLVISGINYRSREILDAAANVAISLSRLGKKTNLSMIFPECNSVGIGMMDGKNLDEAFERIKDKSADTVIILENDLYLREKESIVDQFLNTAENVIVLDHSENRTTSKAYILIPVGTFAESTGSMVNNEGRAQRFFNAVPVKFPVLEGWKWLQQLSRIRQKKEKGGLMDYNKMTEEIAEFLPVFKNITQLNSSKEATMLNEKIARQTPRFSGRTAILANIKVSEPAPPDDPDTPLAFTMEGGKEKPPSSLVPFYWYPGWNSLQALYKYTDEPNGSLKGGDPGIRSMNGDESKIVEYFRNIPEAFVADKERLFIVPACHIYGSEELSARCNAISERIDMSTLYINTKEEIHPGLKSDESVLLNLNGYQIKVKISHAKDMPKGIAALFNRIDEIPWLNLPAWGKITRQDSVV